MVNVTVNSKETPCPLCSNPTYTIYPFGNRTGCFECWQNDGPVGVVKPAPLKVERGLRPQIYGQSPVRQARMKLGAPKAAKKNDTTSKQRRA